MEEKVLEILNTNISGYQLVNDDDPILIAGKERAAKEITEMMMEFIEWIRVQILTKMTIEELFQYWLDNVRGK